MKYINKLTPIFILLFSVNALSYGTFLNSSSLLNGSEYDVSGVTEFFSGDRSGTHLMGMVDLPFTKETNLRFYGGVASLDFSLGANIKWVPIKTNSKNQFNFGGVASAEYGRDGGIDAFLFRAAPFISKAFSWEHGSLEPYAAIPLGVVAVDSSSDMTSQFVIGSKVKFDSLNYMSFSAETGVDIKNSESYFALMATVMLRK
ncbi:MAG: hypothetical protein ACRBBP_09520 [Bdellovibrionales bacterium]